MYPLKFKRHFVDKVWGGRAFNKILNMDVSEEKLIGESWEVSSHRNGMSIVENGDLKGKTLKELVEEYKDKLVGVGVYKKYGSKFPLLIKYLDINDRLSVQVHPNDEYALKYENEFGKSECWYIMEASSDAKLILGIKSGISKSEFVERTKVNNFDGVFNEIAVKKGDFINITPGLVHASLSGNILLCEIQQSSDTTYRIYDFNRKVDGKLRELHLEKAYDVIDFNKYPEINNERVAEYIGTTLKEKLLRCEYFNVDRLKIEKEYTDLKSENFKIYSILDGLGNLVVNGYEYPLKKGDNYLIPANLEVVITGNIELLKSWI
ncbi:type I phosphomannose isomerase catalytic subunit [Fusobacterium hominis]|uniref:Phosphohexomutase n=1 Tax=Fusobacterium hominis TaxID=2764326 RepID=A0A7G9GWV2_9FUSO|nr:type I phosphomannose isomerase catalytic subunit [Fusobacterium hominis]QNM15284.1 class I mannose-6-phosphate isomerase [Fusobacterium hominis]